MTDLVLVRPTENRRAEAHWSRALPLGLGYLAASARSCGLNVSIVDGKILGHDSNAQTVSQIKAQNPFFVGITALTIEYSAAREIASLLKVSPNSPFVVIGGVHANALPRHTLSESPEFDYLIVGEGETSLVELVQSVGNHSTLNDISGLYYHNAQGAVVSARPARFDHDLSTLPFPAWDLFPRQRVYPILAERGCPYSCVFCSNNMSRKVRYRPVEHVIEELDWLAREFQPEQIYFEDETFGLHADRTERLLTKMIAFNKGKGIRFKAQTRVDRINDSLLRLMKLAGFEYLEIGVESGDQQVLEKARKGTTVNSAETAIAAVKRAGIKPWANFIIGLPGETRETVKSSIKLAVKLNPKRLSAAIIVAYPGTDIYEWARSGQNGYRLISQNWAQFDKYLSASVELDTLSYPTMRALQLRMYTETYLRNLRLLDFLRLLWNNRGLVKPVIRSLIPVSGS